MNVADKRVLVVDDDAATRKLMRRYLRDYTVLEAVDGVEGWQAFLEGEPDVVITDLKMPERDGMSLFHMIRSRSPEVPVIILSGVGEAEDIIEFLRGGAHDFLVKPLEKSDIVTRTVNKALDLQRLKEISRDYQHNLEKAVEEKTAKLQEELAAKNDAQREIQRARREWERTSDAIPDLIAIIDKNYKIIRKNKAMAEALGSREENEGLTCFAAIHGVESPPSTCPHSRLLGDGHSHTTEIYSEQLGGYFEVTAVPFFSEDKEELIGSVHIARDINERKELEAEREKMQVKLLHTQKLESVGQLAAGIAHEINTPIQFVGSNTVFLEESFQDIDSLIRTYDELFQAVKDGTVDESLVNKVAAQKEETDWEYLAEDIPSALEQNKEGLKRVTSIVRAMKEFSHPGSKEKEARSINDILRTTGTVARNEWKYVADLRFELEENLPEVMCFSDDIGQVFLNIIINASHAIEEKLGRNPEGAKGVITVRTRQWQDYVEIAISDTGVGMPRDRWKKIFDPFYTTKKVGRGTGQGLAITWNIVVNKHGGLLEVESEEGAGTTFTIKLPREAGKS